MTTKVPKESLSFSDFKQISFKTVLIEFLTTWGRQNKLQTQHSKLSPREVKKAKVLVKSCLITHPAEQH